MKKPPKTQAPLFSPGQGVGLLQVTEEGQVALLQGRLAPGLYLLRLGSDRAELIPLNLPEEYLETYTEERIREFLEAAGVG